MIWLTLPSLTASQDAVGGIEDLHLEETTIDVLPEGAAIHSDYDLPVSYFDDGGYGNVIDLEDMGGQDGIYSRLIEVDTDPLITVNFAFDRVFVFAEDVFCRYLNFSLVVRGYVNSAIAGYWQEPLRFYFSNYISGPWIEMGVISAESPTTYTWPLLSVIDSDQLYIRAKSTIDSFDWGSCNEWCIDYFAIRCIDRKSENVGVSVGGLHDGDNIYPYKGQGNDDFCSFSCTIRNEEGFQCIDYVRLRAQKDSIYLWGAEWGGGDFSLYPWSNGVRLIQAASYTGGMTDTRVVVFSLQFTYGCDDVDNIELVLYHESDTWASERVFSTNINQKPAIEFDSTPTIVERCNPGSSPLLTGDLRFADSPSGVSPHPSHAYLLVTRISPAPTGEWSSGTYLGANGAFQVSCQTKGTAGTVNRFTIRLYESSSLEEPAQFQDDVIETTCDSIVVYGYGVVDSSIPIGMHTTLYTRLRYFSDGVEITNGDASWSGIPLQFIESNSRWEGNTTSEGLPTTISYSLLDIVTELSVSVVHAQPIVSVNWLHLDAMLHLDAVVSNVLVSTVYDPQTLVVSMWITNSSGHMIPGWINVSINGFVSLLYSDGTEPVNFTYSPQRAGDFSIYALFIGDEYHSPSEQTLTGLRARLREITFDQDFPSSMAALVTAPFSIQDVCDNEYQGIFDGITYIRNYPVNVSLRIWWTLSPDYDYPLIFVGSWNITLGEGCASWILPWDLDGDGRLTEYDFLCYLVIRLDGRGVYEDTLFRMPVVVTQPLVIDLEIPALTYSDGALLEVGVCHPFDQLYEGDLSIEATLYVSSENESWVLVDTFAIGPDGSGTLSWVCDLCGSVYFKCVTSMDLHFTQSVVYYEAQAQREGTVLSLVSARRFTYSDQGVIVARLLSDDGTPLEGCPVYLEILDRVWISIGSGLTNETGYVSILWIPLLPSGNYSIRLRTPLNDPQLYFLPSAVVTIINIGKEILILHVEGPTSESDEVSVRVIDDEGNALEGVDVEFFSANDIEPIAVVTSDSDGYARISSSLVRSRTLRAVVPENDFYLGAEQVTTLSASLGRNTVAQLLLPSAALFLAVVVFSAILKRRKGAIVDGPPLFVPPEELTAELQYERDEGVEVRRRDEALKRRAGLTGSELEEGEIVTDGASE